ncbi:MAG: spore maturation protein [Mahellales bacterium]|jgi:spore maturation protein B
MIKIINLLSTLAIPLFISGILVYGFSKGVKVYEVFVEGAKEGLLTSLRIIPYLVAMFVAIGIFRSSGAMELITHALTPIMSRLGIPPEVLPIILIRPMSGIAAIGMFTDLVARVGPDSFPARLSATMMGSTETIFYTLSVYFGSVGITNIRHTLIAALCADLAGLTASLIICRAVFA